MCNTVSLHNYYVQEIHVQQSGWQYCQIFTAYTWIYILTTCKKSLVTPRTAIVPLPFPASFKVSQEKQKGLMTNITFHDIYKETTVVPKCSEASQRQQLFWLLSSYYSGREGHLCSINFILLSLTTYMFQPFSFPNFPQAWIKNLHLD